MNLTPQVPAEGILKANEYGNSKVYTIPCTCGMQEDEINLEIEADELNVCVHIWSTLQTNWWDDRWAKRYDIENEFLQEVHWFGLDLINGIWNRVKLTWQLWTKGYLQQESWCLMTKQQALNLSETLRLAIDDVESFRNEKMKKNES